MKSPFVFAGLLLAATVAFAQTTTQTPSQSAAQLANGTAALPHDEHEGITVSADVYSRAARGKEKFGKANPLPLGVLPVEVFLRNDTNLPVRLGLDSVQLEVKSSDGGSHQDLDWISPLQVATLVAHPGGPAEPKMRRFPISVALPKDDKRDKMLDIIKPLALDADIIPPKGTIHGFLFFDVAGRIPAPGDASLYLPDLRLETSNKPLMFFEVILGEPGTAAP